MLQTTEISNDHLIRTLRVYVSDLTAKYSPFTKNEDYLRDLASWIACAATRIEKLSVQEEQPSNKRSTDV